MSLLMEALKKAERAKQGQGEQPVAVPEKSDLALQSPDIELSLQPQDQAAPEIAPMPELNLQAEPVRQEAPREELTLAAPEPSTPEPAPPVQAKAEPAAPVSQPPLQAAVPPPAEPKPELTASGQRQAVSHSGKDERAVSAAQQTARTVFAAKAPTRGGGKKRTWLIAGAAAVTAIGLTGFGFYYWQMVSTSTMAPPAVAPQLAIAPAGQAGGAPATEAPADTAATGPAAPVQSAAAPPGPSEKPARPPADTYEPAPAKVRSEPEPIRPNPAIQIRQSSTPSQINPALSKGYQAFLAGDADAAQQHYQKALQQDANNRDALLGLAAIALHRKQAGQAASLYTRLLELDPADPEALAGLIGVQGQTDPVQSETRLKKILAQNPQAAAVHFALGNVYSQQSRWAEAQQSYFRAFSSAPANADYAFNLAVSLDFLNQGKLALEYYQRALNLARSGPANFDKASAQTRVKELQQPAGE